MMTRFGQEGNYFFERKIIRRGLALLLSLSMVLPMFSEAALLPASAAADYAGGPCEHHSAHTENCGYAEASPCGFVCPDCAGTVEGYVSGPCEHHTGHTEDCGYAEGSPCGFMCDICSAQEDDGRNDDQDPAEQPSQDEDQPGGEQQPGGDGEQQPGGQSGNDPQLAPGIVELPQTGIQPGDLFSWDVVFPENDPRFSEEDKAWIVAELRRIESLYNQLSMGIAPASFLDEKGEIPWDIFDPVTNVNRDDVNEKFKDDWDEALKEDSAFPYKTGYPVDLEGLSSSKFPSFFRLKYTGVSVDGIPARILGLLTMRTGNVVYYYLATEYNESTDSARVSAVVLGEGKKFTVTYTYDEFDVEYEIVVEGSAYGLGNKPDATSPYIRETDAWPSYYDESAGRYVPYTYEEVEQFLMGGTKNTSSVALANSFDVYLANLYDYQVQVLCYRAGADGKFNFNAVPNENNNNPDVVDLTAQRSGDKKDHTVNRGNPIGMEPVYDEKGEVAEKEGNGTYGMLERVDGVTKPTTRLFATTFYEDDMTTNLYVKLVLKRLYSGYGDDVPVFDARPFMNTNNSGKGDRGSTAKVASGVDQRSQMDGNVVTADEWNWKSDNSEIGGKITQKTIAMTWDEKTNSYSYTWTFQTNDGDNYQLDRMILNNVEINIPVKPLDAWWQQDVNAGRGLGNYDKETNEAVNKNGTSAYHPDEPTLLEEGINCTTLTLSDGTTIKLIYVRYFNTGKKPQRVYQLQITNAHSHVHITMANLFQSASGAPEIAASGIRGVYTTNEGDPIFGFRLKYKDVSKTPNETFITWEDEKLVSDPIYVFHNSDELKRYDQSFVAEGDDEHYGANIHFKVMTGYENPEYGIRMADVGAAENQSTYVWEYDKETGTYIQTDVMKENPVIPLDADKEDASELLHGKHLAPDRNDPSGFSEKEGYLTDGKLDVGYIYGPDADGWYYVRLDWNGSDPKMVMVRVQAMKQEYMVHYRPGEVGRTNVDMNTMPNFDHSTEAHSTENWWGALDKEGTYLHFYQADQFLYNDNSGLFYDLSRNTSMATAEKIPEVDLTKPDNPYVQTFDDGVIAATKVFHTWALGDENSNPIYTYKDADGTLQPAYVCEAGVGFTEGTSSGYSSVPPASTTTDTSAAKATPKDITEGGGELVIDSNTREPQLWMTIDPAKALLLEAETPNGDPVYKFGLPRDLAGFAPEGEEAMINGASNVSLYVIRLVAVWDPAPTKFNYNIWMVVQNPDGSYEAPIKLQRVDTENLVYENDESSKWLPVMVDIENSAFVEWMASNPFYTFDTDKNTTVSAPDTPETNPETGESANYYIQGEYHYYVTDGGDVYIYLKKSNGELKIKNIVKGVSEDSQEEFTYRITVKNPDTTSLPKKADTYYYWFDDGTVSTAANAHLFDFDFYENDGEPYSMAEITLKANQAIKGYLPEGTYVIEEVTEEHLLPDEKLMYNLEIGDDKSLTQVWKVTGEGENKKREVLDKAELERDVIPGEYAKKTAVFQYSVQPTLPENSVLEVVKTVNVFGDYDIPGDSYTFQFRLTPPAGHADDITMNPPDETISIVVNTSNKDIKEYSNQRSFSPVTFSKEGVYLFTVTELTNGLPEGFTAQYKSLTWTADVVNNLGQLEMEPGRVKFVNNYVKLDPSLAYDQPQVNVELIGSYLRGSDFNYSLTLPRGNDNVRFPGAGGAAVNNNDGTIEFNYIEFKDEGTYEVKIEQLMAPNPNSVDLDPGKITVTYDVKKDASGKLKIADTSYSKDNMDSRGSDNHTFKNIASVTQDITVKKSFISTRDNSEMPWGQNSYWDGPATFTAKVTQAGGDASEAEISSERITFNEGHKSETLTFTLPGAGTYNFEVTEEYPALEESLAGVSYDPRTYRVAVTVTDYGGGDLRTATTVSDGEETRAASEVTIKNTYNADILDYPILAQKILEDSDTPLEARQFRFNWWKDVNNNGTVYNNADGSITFPIRFVSSELVVDESFHIKLTEVNDKKKGVIYDETVYYADILVERAKKDDDSAPLKVQGITYTDANGNVISSTIPVFRNKIEKEEEKKEEEPKDPVNPGPDPGPGGGGSTPSPKPDKPGLNTEDHYAYLIGYEDGTVRPDANITRAEAVTIFFRLLTDAVRDEYWTTINPYPDVERTDWYNNAISTMTNLGIVDGYPDGTFRPNANITRAELTKIAVGFFRYADLQLTGRTRFSDVPQGLWYTRFIEAATQLGLIEGYPDNTFRPEQAITRAETVTIVNRALGRKPHRDGLLTNMITWPDNMNKDVWYYADIQEATNSHDYRMGLYSSDGTWYYPDDLHSQDFRMGWDRSIGTWNWTEDMRDQDFLLCWHKTDGKWYYTDMREADSPHDFVICQHKSDGSWTWRYTDDIQGNTASANFPMIPYDGTWEYPDDTDTDDHDFLLCWHKSDGSWTWYYADDLRENTASHNFQMVLYGTDGAYENWTALLPVRDWAAFERMWAELHPEVWNPGEVMDRALPSNGIANGESGEKREEEKED